MIVSDYIAHWLRRRGISWVFTLPGGMISPLLDALGRAEGLSMYTLHHEQGVAFATDGVGRMTGWPALGLATVGPGALNLLTGMAGCYCDSSPALFITGQVQTYQQRGTRRVRQFGMQECDIVAMASPVTKAAWRVEKPAQVPDILEQALTLSTQGRPGPVLIDLPMDVQGMEVGGEPAIERPALPAALPVDAAAVEEVLAALVSAARPLILAGGGVRAARVFDEVRELSHWAQVPVVSSIMALDALPASDPLRVGFIGIYGNRWANTAVAQSDLILVLGSRLDPGQTAMDAALWRHGRQIFHVDCDASELNLRLRGCRTIEADLKRFLPALLDRRDGRQLPDRSAWLARIEEWRAGWPDTGELAGCDGINPNRLVEQISLASGKAIAFVLDAGQHTWWSSQSLRPHGSQRVIAATGMGAMGVSLPAGIGIAVAGGGPVVVLVGDGSLQINIQELQTVARHRIPLKIVVFNNRCHGAVRELQERVFGGRYPATLWGYSAPDFARVAEAYGIAGRSVGEPEGVADALRWLWQQPAEPALLQVYIETATGVYPNVPFGYPLTTMARFSKPEPIPAQEGVSPVPAAR